MSGITDAERDSRDRQYELGLKRCNTCTEPLPLVKFRPRYDGYKGLNGSCRVCCNAKTADYQKRNPEKVAARVRSWRAENRERRLLVERRYAERVRWRRQDTVTSDPGRSSWPVTSSGAAFAAAAVLVG